MGLSIFDADVTSYIGIKIIKEVSSRRYNVECIETIQDRNYEIDYTCRLCGCNHNNLNDVLDDVMECMNKASINEQQERFAESK